MHADGRSQLIQGRNNDNNNASGLSRTLGGGPLSLGCPGILENFGRNSPLLISLLKGFGVIGTLQGDLELEEGLVGGGLIRQNYAPAAGHVVTYTQRHIDM